EPPRIRRWLRDAAQGVPGARASDSLPPNGGMDGQPNPARESPSRGPRPPATTGAGEPRARNACPTAGGRPAVDPGGTVPSPCPNGGGTVSRPCPNGGNAGPTSRPEP